MREIQMSRMGREKTPTLVLQCCSFVIKRDLGRIKILYIVC